MASNRPINCTVKDSKSGQPLVGVAVEVHLLNAGIVRNPLARGTTDGNGAFSCALALPDDLHLGHVTTQPCLFMRVEDGDGRWAVSKAAFLADGRNGAVELGLGVAGFAPSTQSAATGRTEPQQDTGGFRRQLESAAAKDSKGAAEFSSIKQFIWFSSDSTILRIAELLDKRVNAQLIDR